MRRGAGDSFGEGKCHPAEKVSPGKYLISQFVFQLVILLHFYFK